MRFRGFVVTFMLLIGLSTMLLKAAGNTLTALSFSPRPEGEGQGVRALTADLLAYIALTSPADRSGAVIGWDSSTNKSTATGGMADVGSTLAWSADGRVAWWAASEHSLKSSTCGTVIR